MRATVRVSNQMLSQVLFGNDEIAVESVAMYETGPQGFIEFKVNGNRDIIQKEGAELIIEFRTEIRIIDRKIKVAS